MLINDLDIKKYTTLRDVDHAIEMAIDVVKAYRKDNPSFFRAGTDFVTKSLGFVDPDFRTRHRFSQRTREAFAKYEHMIKPRKEIEEKDKEVDEIQRRVAEPDKWIIKPTIIAAIIGAILIMAAALISLFVSLVDQANRPPNLVRAMETSGRNMTTWEIVQANREAVVFLVVRGVGADGVSREVFGTGFLVSSRGHLITAKHIVFGDQMTNTFQVMGAVGSRYESLHEIEFRAQDPDADLVLLQFSGNRTDYKTVSVCMGVSLDVGADLVTIGFPVDSKLSVIKGVLSNKNGPGGLWQAVLGVVPGYDGAPVFTTDGQVVGSVRGREASSAVFTPVDTFSYLLAKLPQPTEPCE